MNVRQALSSEIVFLRIELDERSSIIEDTSKLPHFQKYISSKINKLPNSKSDH